MRPSESDMNFSDDESPSFTSHGCVNIFIDGPGDHTVRPARPSLVAAALAERERIARWKKLLEEEGKEETP